MRARAREVDVIVQKIAAAMVAGAWPGTLAEELVEAEGVKPKVVGQWAAEAGRLLRIGPDVELYRGINLRRLDTHAVSSDGKVAVAAVSEQNKMLGLHAPTMHKVDVSVQAYAKLDDTQMLEHVETQIARLTELRTKLLAKKAIPALPVHTEDDDE